MLQAELNIWLETRKSLKNPLRVQKIEKHIERCVKTIISNLMCMMCIFEKQYLFQRYMEAVELAKWFSSQFNLEPDFYLNIIVDIKLGQAQNNKKSYITEWIEFEQIIDDKLNQEYYYKK